MKQCNKCKECHGDLDIEKALGTFQICIMHEMSNCDNLSPGDLCMLHRKIKSYDVIVETLKQYKIIVERK